MNLRDLEYVVAIAEHMHMARASEHCHVSQSTLSIQLKKLEDELGVKIFERNNRRIKITTVGTMILESARTTLREASRLHGIAREYQNPYSGEFQLGLFPTLAPYLLPVITRKIQKAHPHLHLSLAEEKSPELITKLLQGDLDAALLALPIQSPNLEYKFLFADPFYFACHKSHPLAKKSRIDVTDLKNAELLLLEDGHCFRNQALEVCQLASATENRAFRGTSLETLRRMVAANLGVTLMPKIACLREAHLKYIPFVEKRTPSRQIAIVYRSTSTRRKVIESLKTLISKSYQENVTL